MTTTSDLPPLIVDCGACKGQGRPPRGQLASYSTVPAVINGDRNCIREVCKRCMGAGQLLTWEGEKVRELIAFLKVNPEPRFDD